MCKKLFFGIFSLVILSTAFSQSETIKKDTTEVFKNDIYWNLRVPTRDGIPFIPTTGFSNAGAATTDINLSDVDYNEITRLAYIKYERGQFAKAIDLYKAAFTKSNAIVLVKHRYNLACCYVKTNNIDSAFTELFKMAETGDFFNYFQLKNESCFTTLQIDIRWEKLVAIIKENARKLEEEMKLKEKNN